MRKKMKQYEEEHLNMVRSMAPECTVLLKKDGTFPMKEAGKIALYGNGVRKTIQGGTGSGGVNTRFSVNIEEGLEHAGFTVTTKSWLDSYDIVVEQAHQEFVKQIKSEAKKLNMPATMYGMGKVMPEPEYEIPLEGEGNTAIYVLSRISGEGSDRIAEKGDIYLTDIEIRDIKELNQKYEKFLLVLNTGGMVDILGLTEVKNIIILGQLGSSTGEVLADLLLGKSYPSGKLAMTWAAIEEYPSTKGFGDLNDTVYTEGIYVGYRYFDKSDKKSCYPFGYGLGYTDFLIKVLDSDFKDTEVKGSVLVKNTGDFRGKEVVQFYLSSPSRYLEKPVKELIGFVKTKELLPGEEQIMEYCFDLKTVASFDEKRGNYLLESGEYELLFGTDSLTVNSAHKFTLKEEIVIDTINKDEKSTIRKNDSQKSKKSWEEVKNGICSIEEFAEGLTDDELIYLCIGNYEDQPQGMSIIGASSMQVPGAAGETTGRLGQLRLPSVVMADGPAGLRVSTKYKIVDGKKIAAELPFGEDMLQFMDESEIEWLRQSSNREGDSEEIYEQYCTAIPIGTDVAQSFNTDLAEKLGDIVGNEMERFGVQLWLAPALNIQRNPLCGRNFEYYSEDPLVSGKIAAAISKGVQKHKNCGVVIKHFACNNQETNRYASNSVVSQRALREIYLRSFEICIKEAEPAAVMTSYNLINGIHTANDRNLLTDILRKEWGYNGAVVTDWYVTADMMRNPSGKYQAASAAGCVKAGNDLIMPGRKEDFEDILNALKNENSLCSISRENLVDCAVHILHMILNLTEEK